MLVVSVCTKKAEFGSALEELASSALTGEQPGNANKNKKTVGGRWYSNVTVTIAGKKPCCKCRPGGNPW